MNRVLIVVQPPIVGAKSFGSDPAANTFAHMHGFDQPLDAEPEPPMIGIYFGSSKEIAPSKFKMTLKP